MTNKNLIYIGAAVLAVGSFCPVVSAPMVGSVNLLTYSNYVALALLAAAALAAAMVFVDRTRDAVWPAAASVVLLTYGFVRLQWNISTMREAVQRDLAGNPFAGMAQMAVSTIQIQWGWLLLFAGAALMAYAALAEARRSDGVAGSNDQARRAVTIASALLVVLPLGIDLYRSTTAPASSKAETNSGASTGAATSNANEGVAASPANDPDKSAYIDNKLKLYDFEARYFDAYDGQKTGVNFKIKNNGDRTLNKVTVRVIFMDEAGKPIAEEDFTPVIVSEYSIGDNTPLRPNYIYQNERDKFWVAEHVPSEWKNGNARATITDIEFAPESK